MTLTSAPNLLSTPDAPAGSVPTPTGVATSTRSDPVALISGVTAQLVRSTDPALVFGSLAVALARHTGTHCTVELLDNSGVRVIEAAAASDSVVTGEQPSLSPAARQLLTGDGSPVASPDWFALPIGAVACQDADVEIPVGVLHCRFANRRADHAQLEPIRYLLSVATDLLQSECRLVKAQNQVANLEIALQSNRDIGTAIGILMNSHLVTQDQAFGMLRTASQHGHRKLREVANEVIFTGSIGAAVPGRTQARPSS